MIDDVNCLDIVHVILSQYVDLASKQKCAVTPVRTTNGPTLGCYFAIYQIKTVKVTITSIRTAVN